MYHISDKLTNDVLCFNSSEEIDFSDEEKQDITFFVGMLFRDVMGLRSVIIEPYKIAFLKSPVFQWYELEEDILLVIDNLLTKNRDVYFIGRNLITPSVDNDNNILFVRTKII